MIGRIRNLQLLLYFYCTSRHASTGFSPYDVLFGSNPPHLHITTLGEASAFDPATYCTSIQCKLMELRELVEANTVRLANDQQTSYKCSPRETLAIGQEVLLQNPTAQKLDPHWTGQWVVTEIKSPLTVTINREGTIMIKSAH